jgi:cellulose 1,4-beta-cellobiosidase
MFFAAAGAIFFASSLTAAQKVGTHVMEEHPPLPLWTCSSDGCTQEMKSVVLDANWRWIHNGEYTNCYKDSKWDAGLCPDPDTCAQKCHLDGASIDQYANTYGIHSKSGGLKLDFVTETSYGKNFGSRVYMMEDATTYKAFRLKNREFTLTVDMKDMPCGLNSAVYFVEMDADGGMARSHGQNSAGAAYGTGYCDAQCPHDIKFINGQANIVNWNSTSDPPIGHHGSCCAEMDIWEANSRAAAYTAHPCSIKGQVRCEGTECGDNTDGHRYDGVCDKDGCDFNSYRMGAKDFYGRHKGFTLDATQKVTVVTQFLTVDGTDTSDLSEIRRFYVQNGVIVPNSYSSIAGVKGNSITDQFCSDLKSTFGDINDLQRKGGLKAMGDALDRGMVLVFSLWDDSLANMLWLDADYPTNVDPASHPGVSRGPCKSSTGSPSYVRSKYPSASVQFSEIKVGTLNSTFGVSSSGDAPSDPFGGDRRLAHDIVV